MPKTFLVRQKIVRDAWNDKHLTSLSESSNFIVQDEIQQEQDYGDYPLDFTIKGRVQDDGKSAFEYWPVVKKRLLETSPLHAAFPVPINALSPGNCELQERRKFHLDLNNNTEKLYSLCSQFPISPTPTANGCANALSAYGLRGDYSNTEALFWRNVYHFGHFGYQRTDPFQSTRISRVNPYGDQVFSPSTSAWKFGQVKCSDTVPTPALPLPDKHVTCNTVPRASLPVPAVTPSFELINGGYGIKNPLLAPECNAGKDASSIRSGLRDAKFSCKICGKGFEFPKLLQRHLKSHTEVKRYLCTFCGKGFNDTFDLKRHTRTHTGVRPYKCELCDKAFTQRCSLESHCRKIHGVEFKYGYKERRGKIYVCEDCGHVTDDPDGHFVHIKESHPYNPAILRCYDKRHFKFNEETANK